MMVVVIIMVIMIVVMPVYLVFLQVAKKNLQLDRRGPNLPSSLEACILRQGTGTKEIFTKELCFVLSKLSVG